MLHKKLPFVNFSIFQKDKGSEEEYLAYVNNTELFENRRVIIFALPGAFTPTCTALHLPEYEDSYNKLKGFGIDEVYCLSVNDVYTMKAWFQAMDVEKVKMLADGNGTFTRAMGMLVDKSNLELGYRSWRYSMVVNNEVIEKIFIEPGYSNLAEDDPLTVSDMLTMKEYLKNRG